MKQVCAVIALSLLAAGCTTSRQAPQTPAEFTKEIDNINSTLSAKAGNVFNQCINFAATGKAPSKDKFAKHGYSPTFGLGSPAFFRPKVEGGSTFPGSKGITFAFISWLDRCTITDHGVGGGIYLLANWSKKELTNRGWKKEKGGTKYRSRYTKDGIEIELSGSQTGGIAQVVLHQTSSKNKNSP